MHLRFAWQAWHLETSTCIWHGRGALCDMHLHFAWQAWRLETSTCIWGNRRATWRHLPAFGVAGVALVAFGGALGRATFVAAWHLETSIPAFGVAGVALGDIYLRLAWQAWHLETSTCVWRGRRGSCSPWWPAWSPLVSVGRLGRGATLRGRRGTWRHLPSFHVAGVALGDIYLRLAVTWRHLPAFGVAGSAPLCVAGVALGWRHLPSFHVAGVALGDIYLRLPWQAWRLETSICLWRCRRGTCCTWWRAWSPLVTWGAAPLCVAGIALGGIYLRFGWLAWHSEIGSRSVLRSQLLRIQVRWKARQKIVMYLCAML